MSRFRSSGGGYGSLGAGGGGGGGGSGGAAAFSTSTKGAAAAWGTKSNNFGLGYGFTTSSGNMLSAHSRRKQDDEILAELENDPTAKLHALAIGSSAAQQAAAQAAAAAEAEAAQGARQRRRGATADGERRDGREKSQPITSLPREDAHRFRATLDEAVERLDLLGLITADSLRRRKDPGSSSSSASRAAGGARKDIFSLMRREGELEAQFEQLMHRRNELRGLSNKSKYMLNQAELAEVTAALKASTAAIAANLKDHPTVLGNINKIQRDRQALQNLLQDTIDELKEEEAQEEPPADSAEAAEKAALAAAQAAAEPVLGPDGQPIPPPTAPPPSYSYDVLVDAVNRRSSEQKLLVETRQRQEKTAEALKKLELELEHEWTEFERIEDSKNAMILDLTAQLKHLRRVTGLTVKYEQQTAVAARETLERRRASRLADLRTQIARTKAALKTDKRVHKKSLVFLAGQKDAMDALHERWEREYDEDHGAKSRELDDLSRVRHTDQVALVAHQNRWSLDNAAKIALLDEMRVRGEEEANYRALLERMHLAQCTIRFYWKVYWRRRKKELKKLKRKKMARIRAQKKAEKNRPPSFGSSRKKDSGPDASGAETDGGATSGGEGVGASSKPGSAPRSGAASAKASAR